MAIEFWVENGKYWAKAYWMEEPVSGKSWYEVHELAIRAKYEIASAAE